MNTTEIVELFVETARENYERDGKVDPALFLFTPEGKGLGLFPMPTDDVGDALERLAYVASQIMPVAYIVTVIEMWMRDYDEALTIRKGQLAEMEAAGDPSVETAVVVVVLEAREGDPMGAMAVAKPRRHDDNTITWQNREGDQVGGSLCDRLLFAWSQALKQPMAKLPGFEQRYGDVDFWAEMFSTTDKVIAAVTLHGDYGVTS